ncbi:hypothetical protein evm_013718 [Chilo suppressalis]|nr:hypothetical protein evm_013718 [Chilo suppressalis]
MDKIQMAHSIALCLILKEAHNIDVSRSRRQAQFLRNLDLFTREDDYVNTYRLSEELIKQLENEVSIYLVDTKRKGKGLSNRIKLLCALSFFANGSYQRILGKNIYTHLSQPSMSRNINEIASILCHPDSKKIYKISAKCITTPSVKGTVRGEAGGLGGAVGVVDSAEEDELGFEVS